MRQPFRKTRVLYVGPDNLMARLRRMRWYDAKLGGLAGTVTILPDAALGSCQLTVSDHDVLTEAQVIAAEATLRVAS